MGSKQHIAFPTIFDIDAYASTLSLVLGACEAGTGIVLDFTKTERAYPDGIVPLIATLMRLRQGRELEVELIPPRNDILRGVFDGVGWNSYLRASKAEFQALPKSTPQFTPVRPFTRSELGPLHASMMEVFVRQVRLAPFVAEAAHWALWEVMDNVLNHAKVQNGWVQAATFREHKHINIVVADTGIGIRSSMAQRYPHLTERQAIGTAVEKGETRDPGQYQGNGLHGCRDMAIQNGGQLVVVTGGWKFVQEGVGSKAHKKGQGGPLRRYNPLAAVHKGTVVELMLRTDTPVDLEKALGPHRFVSLLELAHAAGGEFVFDVAQEATDLGTRDAGRRLRNKVLNLSQTHSGQRVVLDFSDVGMVSSSFADEFVAKLLARVGRSQWGERFELRQMNPSVNTVIQIALWQRLDQT